MVMLMKPVSGDIATGRVAHTCLRPWHVVWGLQEVVLKSLSELQVREITSFS
jgi:hypothetical protein